MLIFDSHAHYDDPAFDEDRDELIPLLHESGIQYITNIGCNRQTSLNAAALAETYPFIYAAVGWHPSDAADFNDESAELLRQLAKSPKVRAIGEIGVDYHYPDYDRETQLRVFDRQMTLAEELNLPVVIHQREGAEDCLSIVRKHENVRGVYHCYSGSAETAKELLARGYYIGVTGTVTFKNARKLPEVVQMVPADRLLVETDCPYLAPVPNRGKRNDSRNLPYTIAKIAELRGVTPEEIAAQTLENAKRFYRITD